MTNINGSLTDRWIYCVQTSPFDKATAFVTISGYRWDNYLPHVYRTADNGKTWDDVSGNLPDFPVNCIVLDPDSKNTWYIGTDGGVFFTQNSGATWEIYGSGLPKIPVIDLYLHAPTRTLSAGTFGRSMYKIKLPAATGTDPVTNSQIGLNAYPNPFATQINLSFSLELATKGNLSVYNISGQQICIIHQGLFNMGENQFIWSGNDDQRNPVSPGIYLVRLVTAKSITTIKVQKN